MSTNSVSVPTTAPASFTRGTARSNVSTTLPSRGDELALLADELGRQGALVATVEQVGRRFVGVELRQRLADNRLAGVTERLAEALVAVLDDRFVPFVPGDRVHHRCLLEQFAVLLAQPPARLDGVDRVADRLAELREHRPLGRVERPGAVGIHHQHGVQGSLVNDRDRGRGPIAAPFGRLAPRLERRIGSDVDRDCDLVGPRRSTSRSLPGGRVVGRDGDLVEVALASARVCLRDDLACLVVRLADPREAVRIGVDESVADRLLDPLAGRSPHHALGDLADHRAHPCLLGRAPFGPPRLDGVRDPVCEEFVLRAVGALREVLGHPRPDRLARDLLAPPSREEHERHVRVFLAHRFQELQAVHSRHVVVTHDAVDRHPGRSCGFGETVETLTGARRRAHFEILTLALENRRREIGGVRFVVDVEHANRVGIASTHPPTPRVRRPCVNCAMADDAVSASRDASPPIRARTALEAVSIPIVWLPAVRPPPEASNGTSIQFDLHHISCTLV
jgi:hypothetical protein